MKTKLRNLLAVVMCAVVCMAMSFTPVLADDSTISSGSPGVYENLEGESTDQFNYDEEMLSDPEFYKYYDVDDKGNISEKQVDVDEVDKFIEQMDANAEGISDTEIAEMSSDMNSVGCGVEGLGKGQVPSKYKNYAKYHCIDISWWQGVIKPESWQKVKAAGVSHVIVRASYTSLDSKFQTHMDSKFSQNVNNASAAGLKVGVYHFSQATSVAEANKEADYILSLIESYRSKISLPLVFDYETNSKGRLNGKKISSLSKSGTSTQICEAFCQKVSNAGYTPMIYGNYTMFTNYLDYKSLQSKYRIWLANYTTNGKATTYPGEYWAWQYSSSGKVNGLRGSIDINYIFDNGQGGSAISYPSASSQPSVSTASYYAKTTTGLNYRTGPGTKYKKKGTYRKGTKLKIVGETSGWAKISNGYYASLKHLKKVSASASSSSSYKGKLTNSTNYRTGPGTKYKKKGTYKKGKTLTIVSTSNGWGKMSNGYYIYLKYVKKI